MKTGETSLLLYGLWWRLERRHYCCMDSGSHDGWWKGRHRWWKNKKDEGQGLLWSTGTQWLIVGWEKEIKRLSHRGNPQWGFGILGFKFRDFLCSNSSEHEWWMWREERRLIQWICIWSIKANRRSTPGSNIAFLFPAGKLVQSVVKSRFHLILIILTDFIHFWVL